MTKDEQIQYMTVKWGLKADLGATALKNGLGELWDLAQEQVREKIVKADVMPHPFEVYNINSIICDKCGEYLSDKIHTG